MAEHAYIVTFNSEDGRQFNAWIWPDTKTVEVSEKHDGFWLPIRGADATLEEQDV